MSSDELQVIPEDLAGKATQLRGLSLAPAQVQPSLVPPDALDTTGVAIANLAVNAETLWAYQEFGRLEGLRLAQTLDNVAAAYAEVDQTSGESIAGTVGGPGTSGPPSGSRYPDALGLPPPPHPPSMPIPRGELVSEQVLFPPQAQRALEAGDGGASLRGAAQMWRSNARSLAAAAAQFDTNALQWEGEAADTAYARFNAYRDWLIGLTGSWEQLAGEADRIVDAHTAAKRDNQPIAEQFEKLQAEIAQDPASADNLRKTLQMAALQNQSEEIRHRYARDGQPRQIQPADPPSPVVGGIPVTVADHLRARRSATDERRHQGPWGAGPSSGSATDGAPSASEPHASGGHPAASPTSAQRATPEAPAGERQQSALPGAGQGSAPGGAHPGAAMPTGTQPPAKPKQTGDPSVRPAASGSRGAGSASAGAGAAPPSSLQPAVGAETVAPTPFVAPIAAPAAAAGGSAGVGGATGGVAPMMHGAKGDATGEKKRDPQLSVDQELYTEDRSWTEAVIGNRVRRRGTPEGGKSDGSTGKSDGSKVESP